MFSLIKRRSIFSRITNDLVNVQRHRLDDLLAGEHQELAREGGGAVRGLLDLLKFRPVVIGWVKIVQQQIAVARNHCEQVVEIVSHSPGESADRFHLLRLQFFGLCGDDLDVRLLGLEVVEHERQCPHHGDEQHKLV